MSYESLLPGCLLKSHSRWHHKKVRKKISSIQSYFLLVFLCKARRKENVKRGKSENSTEKYFRPRCEGFRREKKNWMKDLQPKHEKMMRQSRAHFFPQSFPKSLLLYLFLDEASFLLFVTREKWGITICLQIGLRIVSRLRRTNSQKNSVQCNKKSRFDRSTVPHFFNLTQNPIITLLTCLCSCAEHSSICLRRRQNVRCIVPEIHLFWIKLIPCVTYHNNDKQFQYVTWFSYDFLDINLHTGCTTIKR